MTKKRPKTVVLGGGTGTYVVLSGLRDFPVDLTAVVSIAVLANWYIEFHSLWPTLVVLPVGCGMNLGFCRPVTMDHSHLSAILEADLIVLGPGDLYTSLVPNLLVEGVNQAIAKSSGKLVYVCNLMTKHGETDGFGVADYVLEMKRYLGYAAPKLTKVLVNNQIGKIPASLLRRYKQEKSLTH